MIVYDEVFAHVVEIEVDFISHLIVHPLTSSLSPPPDFLSTSPEATRAISASLRLHSSLPPLPIHRPSYRCADGSHPVKVRCDGGGREGEGSERHRRGAHAARWDALAAQPLSTQGESTLLPVRSTQALHGINSSYI
jgi:hypothetical protein